MTNKLTVVAEIAHAAYGASGWSGWGNCPAWQGGGAGNIHAATGSVIHEVSAECLVGATDAAARIGEVFTSDGFEIPFDADHAANAQYYIDVCRDLHKSVGGTMLVEQTLGISHITGEPGAMSTTDYGIIPPPGSTEMIVADLKSGRAEVFAEGNGQLAIYALSMLDEYSLVADIKTVRMIIVQPQLAAVSEWVQTVEQLEAFRIKVTAAATAAQAPNPAPVPGESQCRYCSKAATCSALTAVVFEAVDAVDPTDVASDDLGDAMARVEMIEGWIKSIRAETERRLLDGRTVPGYKLVQGKRGNRAWSSKDDAEKMLKAMRIKHDLMYDYSVISPTSADKLAKSGAIGPSQWTKVQTLITQSDGKPSVAPVSDKREALVLDAITFEGVTNDT